MQLKTILNRVEYFKSFVYGKVWVERPGRRRRRSKCSCDRGRTGDRSARAAASPGRATTGCRSDVSSSCRCGGSPCTSSMRCGGWSVRAVRREGGASSLVRRQESIDHDLSLVPGPLGQAAFVERGRLCLPHDLAERVSLGKTRGFLGAGPSRIWTASRRSAWTRSNGNGGTST